MPWTGQSFQKHNGKLSPAQSAHASHIANHVLQSTGDEGEAIATANKFYQHHRADGGYTPQQGGIGGTTPSTQGSNPIISNLIQRYSGLSTEKLAELAGQLGNSPQGSVINHLLMQRRMQPQNAPDPSITPPSTTAGSPAGAASTGAAPQPTMRKGGGLDGGGDPAGLSASSASPWWTRKEASGDTSSPSLGFLHGPTAGRADALDTSAPAGSHVIPADVVAGLGEGNSLAGAARMESVIRTGPHGTSLPRGGGRSTIPRPPAPLRVAKGGEVDAEQENTPVKLSHGEYVVAPEQVRRWGGGDQKAGHDAWDRWIVKQRKKQIETLKALPGPVKS
jgi:hypothetical protein